MAKDHKFNKLDKEEVIAPETSTPDMTLEEARAYRASLYKPATKKLTQEAKREQFRLFWAQEKYKYGKSKDLEPVLWLHLKATEQDSPEKFEDGIAHFGLKKLR